MDATARVRLLDASTILRAEVGSTAHGVTHASNDLDEIAIYIPPLAELVGLDRPEHMIWRPGRGPHDPSGPGDLDRSYFSLRKFVGLLVKGNPSILFTLFAPIRQQLPIAARLLDRRGDFRTRRTRDAYLGYALAQRQRIAGERGAAGRIRRSPEGGGVVDWKYAMHMVRLGIQGIEYLTTGHISTPSLEREFLLGVRAGEVPLDDVVRRAEQNEAALKALDLPAAPATDWNDLLASMHREWWTGNP